MHSRWFYKLQKEIVGSGFGCQITNHKTQITIKIISPAGSYREYTSSIADTMGWIFHKQCIATTIRRYNLCH